MAGVGNAAPAGRAAGIGVGDGAIRGGIARAGTGAGITPAGAGAPVGAVGNDGLAIGAGRAILAAVLRRSPSNVSTIPS